VQAAFAYGDDLVTYRKLTSNQMEMPDEAHRLNDRQDEAFEELHERIEERLSELGLTREVPILEGFLHHAIDPRAGG
jgi:type II secretory pathway predicted ATPase ExeA